MICGTLTAAGAEESHGQTWAVGYGPGHPEGGPGEGRSLPDLQPSSAQQAVSKPKQAWALPVLFLQIKPPFS